MAGTFAWAAPELLLGARCTEKVDVRRVLQQQLGVSSPCLLHCCSSAMLWMPLLTLLTLQRKDCYFVASLLSLPRVPRSY